MSDLFGIIGIAITGAAAAIVLRNYNPVFGMLTAILTGIVIILRLYDTIGEVIGEMKSIVQSGGVDNRYVETVIKVTGIAYITQFGADMLRDSGESAIASKCELAGKLFILYQTLPVLSAFLKICLEAAEVA